MKGQIPETSCLSSFVSKWVRVGLIVMANGGTSLPIMITNREIGHRFLKVMLGRHEHAVGDTVVFHWLGSLSFGKEKERR